jgi:UDP-N-acetylmuramate dehydrogenase
VTPPLPIEQLQSVCPGGVRLKVDLSQCSWWRVGGLAEVVVSPGSVDELRAVIAVLREHEQRHVIIGSTTNLLFSDDGLRAVCINIGARLGRMRVDGDIVQAESGVWVPAFARAVMKAGLAGAEHVCGIPGTLGGLVCMNGGSQRKGIGDAVTGVSSVDSSGNIITRTRDECEFAYRASVFQRNNEVIVASEFKFDHAEDRRAVRREMIAILSSRNKKFPRKYPNCGSVFVSDPRMYHDHGPPGAVIERYGFKGMRSGNAQVSPLHANFIVNKGGAAAKDILALVGRIHSRVKHETGYDMRAEALFVNTDGTMLPLHEAYQKIGCAA